MGLIESILKRQVRRIVNNAIDEIGESSRSFMKILVIPAIIIALVVAIIFGTWLYKKLKSTDIELANMSSSLPKTIQQK